MPQEIDILEREILQLEIERQALTRETDEKSKQRLDDIEKRIADLNEKSAAMKAKWQSEKEEIEKMRTLKAQLDEARTELERARQQGDLNQAAELQYGRIPEIEKLLEVEQQRLEQLQSDGVYLKEEVDEEDVAEVVAKWTGVPVSKMLEGEMQKLIQMEDKLRTRVIGQDEELVDHGALMAYSPVVAEDRQLVAMLDRLLRGANPAEIPFELPTRAIFAINRKAAAAIGVKFPADFNVMADRIVE
jgi:ATP-dependent Clp protease ATP-binding subunit ClpB